MQLLRVISILRPNGAYKVLRRLKAFTNPFVSATSLMILMARLIPLHTYIHTYLRYSAGPIATHPFIVTRGPPHQCARSVKLAAVFGQASGGAAQNRDFRGLMLKVYVELSKQTKSDCKNHMQVSNNHLSRGGAYVR